MLNRLKLDFSLETAAEREEFVEDYLSQPFFSKTPPSKDELEMCANYILWGKDEDDKSSVQRKEIQIDTKFKAWDVTQDIESLNELMENPTFNENLILSLSEAIYKKPKLNFCRDEALSKSSAAQRQAFNDLFRQIDETEFFVNWYDYCHGKRKDPPREELSDRIEPSRREALKQKVSHTNQFMYLKFRHLLVELRRQQYTLKDSISPQLIFDNLRPSDIPPLYGTLDVEIPVFPLGLKYNTLLSSLIFREPEAPLPAAEENLKLISDFIWEKEEQKAANPPIYFDFRKKEHVYQLFKALVDIEDAAERNFSIPESTLSSFISTLEYYLKNAGLNDVQELILRLKVSGRRNQEIADIVNRSFNKGYTDNYISTILRQTIIGKVNEAATYHEEVIRNIFFKEEFKKCTKCGVIYLRDTRNFVRKSRAIDGLSNRCKKCDKLDREQKKKEKEGKK